MEKVGNENDTSIDELWFILINNDKHSNIIGMLQNSIESVSLERIWKVFG